MTAPSLPPDQRLYVVGDLHGRRDLLERLMASIAQNAARQENKTCKILFLGDYIDRGMDSRGVLDFLIQNIPASLSPVFLRGNHDHYMLRFATGDMGILEKWLTYGGRTTLASYGIKPFVPDTPAGCAKLMDEVADKIPVAHLDFLKATRFSYECGSYFFAHAGIRPGVPLIRQETNDLLFIRKDFLDDPRDHGKIIVHGHTISHRPKRLANRIGIDTGAFNTGHLTCLILDGNKQSFIMT